ncbi:hypothetical protein ACFQ95_05845 [Variovorax sp. HJSM1_2]
MLSRLCAALPGLALASAQAQGAGSDIQIVQRIDNVLIGVDTVSLEVVDAQHVTGNYFLINLKQPHPMAGHANFVVKCQSPPQMATLASTLPSASLDTLDQPVVPPQRRASSITVAQLTFKPVHMLDGTWMAAEFACRSSSAPGTAAGIAQQLLAKGGPPDMRTLYCDLKSQSTNQVSKGVEVRYSESDDAVAVNRQWLSSGYVTDTGLVFGNGAQWVIDRSGREARLVAPDGQVLARGPCDMRQGTAK